MQSLTYGLECRATRGEVEMAVREWWDRVSHAGKSIISDSNPKRFSVKYRQKYVLGRYAVFITIKIRSRSDRTMLKITLTQTELAEVNPRDNLKEIVCWFSEYLHRKSIRFTSHPGIFQKKIECDP